MPHNLALQQTGLSLATLPLAPAAERRYVSRTDNGIIEEPLPPLGCARQLGGTSATLVRYQAA